MISATRRPVLYALASGLLLAITIASDWPFGFLHEYWASNAMVTNVVASMLFVLLTATIFNYWASRREAARLRVVVLATYHAIARVLLDQRRIMWTLANGDDSAWAEETMLTEGQRGRLQRALARWGLTDVTVYRVRTEGEAVPDLGERLSKLVQDDSWAELAYDVFRELTRTSRSVLAQWSPLLVATRDSSGLLLALSEQVEEMAEIVSWLRRRKSGDPNTAKDKNISLWRRAFTNATALEETLRKELWRPGDEPYSYLERRLLEKGELDALVGSRGKEGIMPFRVYQWPTGA